MLAEAEMWWLEQRAEYALAQNHLTIGKSLEPIARSRKSDESNIHCPRTIDRMPLFLLP